MMIPDGNLCVASRVSQSGRVVYHDSQMRRTLAIFLVLLFSVAPLAGALDADTGSSGDARVPACCRRHGAHHCEMTAQAAALLTEAAGGKAIAIAPSNCPAFPGSMAATVSAPHALAAAALKLPDLPARFHSPAAIRTSGRLRQAGTRGDRGPPQTSLA